jgi:hypothetical protein
MMCSFYANAEQPAQQDAVTADIAKLSSSEFAVRDAAKKRLAALPAEHAQRILKEAGKAADPGLKANLEFCAKSIFEDKILKESKEYKMMASNFGLVFDQATIAIIRDNGIGIIHGMVVGNVQEWSTFAGQLKAGDVVIGIIVPGGLSVLPYKPADISEAVMAIFSRYAVSGSELTIKALRPGLGPIDVKGKLLPLPADKLTPEHKDMLSSVSEYLWTTFKLAAQQSGE